MSISRRLLPLALPMLLLLSAASFVPGGSGGNPITPTKLSGTITVGGNAQQIGTSTTRTYCEMQNLSSGDMFITWGGTASSGPDSWWVPAGADRLCPPSAVPQGLVSIWGPSSNASFTYWER